jgi:hypothetical protein
MSRLVVDAMLPEKLKHLQHPVELVDVAGHILGTFLPHAAAALEPKVSEEEIRRRMSEDGGRPLADILADRRKGA